MRYIFDWQVDIKHSIDFLTVTLYIDRDIFFYSYRRVAQVAEHFLDMEGVSSSSLLVPTTKIYGSLLLSYIFVVIKVS